MKYIVILGDGMADVKLAQLGNKTPLEAAFNPYMNLLGAKGELGLVKTVPDNMPPGSDVANLSVMGYNPQKYYTGRSPLEAVSMGVEFEESDIVFRTNLVTLSNDDVYENKTMVDYSSGEIKTEVARELIKFVNDRLGNDIIQFFGGISYRHLLRWKNTDESFKLTPPHDISKKVIGNYLPSSEKLKQLMKESYKILSNHPINLDRISKGINPANSIWIWGQGKKTVLTPFKELYNVSGAVISAVDLVKGIAISAKMDSIDVEGATGNIDTNFSGKAKAALEALKTHDFVYVHMEAPDECGHRFEVENKVRSIEMIDELVVKPIYETLKDSGEDFSILLMPDHPTPLTIGTHTGDPVPYVIYRSNNENVSEMEYNETDAKSGPFIPEGHTIMSKFILK